MERFDVVVIGAGLGGLTAGAVLAREGRKVLVIERSNSVGGAASSYKSGDLFVEGSLHETSDPNDSRDLKHAVLKRAGVLDTVKWVPSGAFYQARGGPLVAPFLMPDKFNAAREALIERFPEARDGIEAVLGDMERLASASANLVAEKDRSLSVSQKLDSIFGDNEAVKCAVTANLSYYHDDPATLAWVFFAAAQGAYLLNGGCYVQGGSQRLSSALARAVKVAGGQVLVRRLVSSIALDANGRAGSVTHTARDGSDPRIVEGASIISNAAPATVAALLPAHASARLTGSYAQQAPSISLFSLTLGLSKRPSEFGINGYSTQLWPDWLKRVADYSQGSALMVGEPREQMPPMSIVDYAAIDAGIPAPPFVLSIFGPDRLSNWDSSDLDSYREKRSRWESAIVRYLDSMYPGIAGAVTASSFNTALSVRQYLNAPVGAVYGFAPIPHRPDAPARSPRTVIPGLYLSSAYAGYGGYTGVIAAAGICADMVLRER